MEVGGRCLEFSLHWRPGLGYWGYGTGGYLWNAGYWGPSVGYYGGIELRLRPPLRR